MLNTLKDKKDGSLNVLHGEGATSSVENAGISYQSASLLAAGGTARDVAVLSSLSNLIFALLLVKVPSLIRVGDALKRSVVVLSIISSLGWLPLIFVTIFVKGISPAWLIVLWIMSLVPDFLVGPLRDKWLSDLVPSKRVGRYLSLRSIISAGTYLSCFYVMGYSLDHFQTGLFSGFTLIFMLAFLASVISLILYLVIKVSIPAGENGQSNIGLVGFVREARQNELGTFIVFTSLVIFTASVSGAFFSVYMLKDLHFSYLTFTLVVSSEFVARIVSSYLWGKLIDSSGAIKVLRTASVLIPFIPIVWLFSGNVGYLIGIQVLSGTAWAAFDLCSQSYLIRASPPEKRLHYIVYHRSIITLASALGPLLGMGLLNVMPSVFGNAILGIFLLSGALRLVVVIAVLPRLKSTGSRELESGETSGEFRPVAVENQTLSDWEPYPAMVKVIRAQAQPQNKNSNYRAVLAERHTPTVPVDTGPTASLAPAFRWADYKSRLSSRASLQRPEMLYHRELWSPASAEIAPEKVARLRDNLSRDIEYHKRWAARVTC